MTLNRYRFLGGSDDPKENAFDFRLSIDDILHMGFNFSSEIFPLNHTQWWLLQNQKSKHSSDNFRLKN